MNHSNREVKHTSKIMLPDKYFKKISLIAISRVNWIIELEVEVWGKKYKWAVKRAGLEVVVVI